MASATERMRSGPGAAKTHDSSFAIGLVSFAIAGFVVALRQPRNSIAWILLGLALCGLLSVTGGAYAAFDYRFDQAALPLGIVAVFLQLCWAPAIALFPLPLLLLPDGHLPSRRWRWLFWTYLLLAIGWVGANVGIAATSVGGQRILVDATGQLAAFYNDTELLPGAFLALWLVWVVRLPVSYRHETGERRQQLKWFMAGGAASGIGVVISFRTPSGWVAQAVGLLAALLLCAPPTGIGIGILKYRLYEIDRLVSRTLAYAQVTGLLVGVCVGLVTLGTRVLPLSSPLGVAASTLAAAALFSPLRRRVQRLVDRRFNPAHYDAQATIAAFALRLREDVGPEAVSEELARAVQLSVEPADVAVWLRPTPVDT